MAVGGRRGQGGEWLYDVGDASHRHPVDGVLARVGADVVGLEVVDDESLPIDLEPSTVCQMRINRLTV